MKYLLVLLLIPSLAQAAATSFETFFTSMGPVDKLETIDTSYQNPLYKSLQFQYRTAGSDTIEVNGASRMSLKLSPLAWGQMEKEKELYREYSDFSKTINREGSSRECLYRSVLLTNAVHIKKSLVILRKVKAYLEDEIKVLKRGIGENLFEFNEILPVREALVKNNIKIAELENLAKNIEKALTERSNKNVTLKDIDFKNFVDVKKIKQTDLTVEPKQVELKKLKSMVQIHNLELDIEKREANKILDAVHLYRWDDNINSGVSYGFELTFNIPYFNKRTYLKDSVDRQIAINKLSLTQRDILSDLEGSELSFRNKIAQFEALKDSDYYKTLKSLKQLLGSTRNNSPLMILQTKVKMANERLKLIDLKHEITQDYLTKLYHSGQISSCQSPSFLVAK